MNIHLTRGEVIEYAQDEFHDSSDRAVSLFYKYIVALHRDLENEVNPEWLIKTDPYEFTVSQGQNSYILPFDFKDIVDLYGLVYDGGAIPIIPEEEHFYKHSDELSLTGSPYEARLKEDVFIQTQVPSTGTITVESSSASDTTQSVYAIGKVGDVLDQRESISLSGTATVAGTLSFQELVSLTLDADTVGTVTIKQGATTLLELPAGVRSRKFARLILFPNPDSDADGNTVIVHLKRRIPDAISDSEPVWFEDSDLYIGYMGMRYYRSNPNKYAFYTSLYNERLRLLKKSINKIRRARIKQQLQPGMRRRPRLRQYVE